MATEVKKRTYLDLRQELTDRHSGRLTVSEMDVIHNKWRRLGKLASVGKLTGAKY